MVYGYSMSGHQEKKFLNWLIIRGYQASHILQLLMQLNKLQLQTEVNKIH